MKEAAKRRVEVARRERLSTRNATRKFGRAPTREVSPSEAVLSELQWSSVHTAWLREQIGEEAGAGYLPQYDSERDRLVKIAKTAADMGVQERQVALAESLGAELILLVSRVVAQLPAAIQGHARRVFYAEIKQLGSGEAS